MNLKNNYVEAIKCFTLWLHSGLNPVLKKKGIQNQNITLNSQGLWVKGSEYLKCFNYLLSWLFS